MPTFWVRSQDISKRIKNEPEINLKIVYEKMILFASTFGNKQLSHCKNLFCTIHMQLSSKPHLLTRYRSTLLHELCPPEDFSRMSPENVDRYDACLDQILHGLFVKMLQQIFSEKRF